MPNADFKCLNDGCGRTEQLPLNPAIVPVCSTCGTKTAPVGAIICQNSNQSGDTYGVAVSLLLEPQLQLVFVTAPEDKGCVEKIALYAGLGVAKERLRVLLLHDGDARTEMEREQAGAYDKLAAWASVCPMQRNEAKLPSFTTNHVWLPNQVCKWMVNVDLFKGALPGSKEDALLPLWYAAVGHAFLDRKKRAPIIEVGGSTRSIAAHLRAQGFPAMMTTLWTQVGLAVGAKDPDGNARSTAAAIAKRVQGAKGVILLWVRSLSGDERGDLKAEVDASALTEIRKRRERGHSIDDFYWVLNAGKRNPHHLMTPQLFATLCYLAKSMGWAVLPIGDEVIFDEYGGRGPTAQVTRNAVDDANLIGFWSKWKWFGGDERRARQMFLLAELFRELGKQKVPLVQVGLRSGEMEKAAYLGVPTVYLEEEVSETGSRMLPVTVGGEFAKNAENRMPKVGNLEPSMTGWWSEANTSGRGSELNVPKVSHDLEHARGMVDQVRNSPGGLKYWEGQVQQLEQRDQIARDHTLALRMQRREYGDYQRDVLLQSVTDHSRLLSERKDGGLPCFFRLTTQHPVGLNAVTSELELQKLSAWLTEKFEDGPAADCPKSVLRGTLTPMEIDILYNLLLGVQLNFVTYLRDIPL